MKVFAFGSSLVSSYWNGAATYYRGCYKYLARLGYEITFAEPDAYSRQQHRDDGDFSYATSLVYKPHRDEKGVVGSASDLDRMIELAKGADIVVKHSGIGVDDAELEERVPSECSATAMTFIWDVDSPATIARMRANRETDALALSCKGYDGIFSYGGGPKARDGFLEFGARSYYSFYNGLDPETHHPVAPDPQFKCDVLFLGNRLPDREARVEDLFFRAAELAPDQSFILGGEGWNDKAMPANVRYVGHVPTAEHNRLNCSASMVLNINRTSMAEFGFSPPTRVFEVAGAGSCMLCDDWPGLHDCFVPGREILVVKDGHDVADALYRHDATARKAIGAAFHQRALAEHTYARRAEQADYAFRECLARRRGEAGPQTHSAATIADWHRLPGFSFTADHAATTVSA